MPYGFDVSCGYLGSVGGDVFILFPTENEYYEYLCERMSECEQK